MDIAMQPVAVVHSSRTELGDKDWGAVESRLELEAALGSDSLLGLDAFSHVVVVYLFHRVEPDGVVTGSRHPRNDTSLPRLGIFAQRAKRRPNRIGVTVCEILGVEGTAVRVRGLDAVDGTPVLDLKPYATAYGPRGEVREPEWIETVMRGYW